MTRREHLNSREQKQGRPASGLKLLAMDTGRESIHQHSVKAWRKTTLLYEQDCQQSTQAGVTRDKFPTNDFGLSSI